MIRVEERWRTCVEHGGGEPYLRHYWDSWQRADRALVAAAVASFDGIETVLEVGCHCGPLIRSLRHRLPHLTVLGIDLSPEAVGWANAYLGAGTAWVASYRTEPIPDVDLIVSTYALAYCPPEDITSVLEDLVNHAAHGVVLCEPMPAPGLDIGPCGEGQEEWRHDYVRRLEDMALEVQRFPVPLVDRMNAYVIGRRC